MLVIIDLLCSKQTLNWLLNQIKIWFCSVNHRVPGYNPILVTLDWVSVLVHSALIYFWRFDGLNSGLHHKPSKPTFAWKQVHNFWFENI